jgi:amino acid adenylation domain-containing protein
MDKFVCAVPPPIDTSLTLASRFLARCEKMPDHVALESALGSVTYRELRQQATQTAATLRTAGVSRGDIVAICAESSIEYLITIVAIVLAGGAYLPIDPKLPRHRVDLIIEDSQPQIVFVNDKTCIYFDAKSCILMCLNNIINDSSTADFVTGEGHPDDLAYVMYTSGSTGTPKGVAVSQSAVVRLVCDVTYARLDSNVRMLQHSPLSFDASTFEIWGSLLNGGACVLMPGTKQSMLEMEEFMLEKSISTTFMTTALARELVEARPRGFRTIRQLITGGEVIPPEMIRKILLNNPGIEVIVAYGPTECTTFTTTHSYRDAQHVPEIIPLGEPIAETSVFLLDENMHEVKAGEIGEIFVGGRRLAIGYLNRPELSAQAFLRDTSDPDANARLYRTGDLGMRMLSGDLLFKGRRDRQIKLRGFRIELEEVEVQLQRHSSVHAAAVSAVTYPNTNEKALVACFVPDRDALYRDGFVDDGMREELIVQWRKVYSDLLYKDLASTSAGADMTMNTAGWTSSFDGREIPVEEMMEQVERTVERILELSPRNVLEIGCGTAMLMFRLAPQSERYVCTDFSEEALAYVAKSMESMGGMPHVSLHQADALDLPTPPPGGFDVVVLNSVTEHFPSLGYLDDLLARLCQVLKPGGHVFIGDNRSFPLLKLFHASVQLFRSSGTMSVAEFASSVEQAVANEQQLTIDPYYFTQLDPERYRCVSLQYKRGTHRNEMTGYRFDAVLQCGLPMRDDQCVAVRSWDAAMDARSEAAEALNSGDVDTLSLCDVPSSRHAGADILIDAVSGNSFHATVGQLRRAIDADVVGEDPEAYWSLALESGYEAHIAPTQNSATGHFDVTFRRRGEWSVCDPVGSQPPRSLDTMANDPLWGLRAQKLAAEIREDLTRCLPEYAVPAFLVPLPRFSLTLTGKIDYSALPLPLRFRSTGAAVPARALAGDSRLAEILRSSWSDVLHIHDIGLNENFFAIGGDSLKAVRLAADLSERLGRIVSPTLMFEAPTLVGLIERLSSPPASDVAPRSSRGTLRRALLVDRRTT